LKKTLRKAALKLRAFVPGAWRLWGAAGSFEEHVAGGFGTLKPVGSKTINAAFDPGSVVHFDHEFTRHFNQLHTTSEAQTVRLRFGVLVHWVDTRVAGYNSRVSELREHVPTCGISLHF
jgi:hypothetical protein